MSAFNLTYSCLTHLWLDSRHWGGYNLTCPSSTCWHLIQHIHLRCNASLSEGRGSYGMFEVGLRCWLRVQDIWNKKKQEPTSLRKGRSSCSIVESMLLWSNPCHLVSWWSNPRWCCRIHVVQLSSLNLWR